MCMVCGVLRGVVRGVLRGVARADPARSTREVERTNGIDEETEA